MVPVYAVLSCAACWTKADARKLDFLLVSIRESYEAVVLTAFIQFLAELWGGAWALAAEIADEEVTVGTVFKYAKAVDKKLGWDYKLANLRLFPWPVAPGSNFLWQTFACVIQYSIVMLFCIFVNCAAWVFGHQEDPLFQKVKYVKLASNIWAFANLFVLFEYLSESERTMGRMKQLRALSKFVCIKLLILVSLWQEKLIKFCASKDMLPQLTGMFNVWSTNDHGDQVGDFVLHVLICVELVIFSQWHRVAYRVDEDWKPPAFRCRPEDYKHQNRWCCVRFGLARLCDDMLYLRKRVRKQKMFVRILKKVRAGNTSDCWCCPRGVEPEKKELKNNFRYFDLNEKEEASIAQLLYEMYRSGCFPESWEQMRTMLMEADEDHNRRLSWSEFQEVLSV